MKRVLDPDDVRFLERLHRLGSGTIQEICADLGVTATAVRQRLTRLQAQDLISRELVRSGDGASKGAKSRGRPHHAYRVSEAGRRELGANYSELAMILWKEIQRIDEPEVKTRVLGRIEQALVEQYGAEMPELPTETAVRAESVRGEAVEGEPARGKAVADRFRQLCGTLASHGFDVEYDSLGGLPILRENNCPYLELATADPSICEMEQAVFRQVLGVSVTLTHCCLDGHHCCEFTAGESRDEESGIGSQNAESAMAAPLHLLTPDA